MELRDQLRDLILQCVREYAEQAGRGIELDEHTPLLGPDSAVDSLGLVMVVTSFEAKLNERFETDLVLANERAMSMNRSPFRSVAALSVYAAELLEEAAAL